MLDAAGAFAAIWLITWLAAGVFFSVFYRLLKPVLSRLHPESGSALLLIYLSGPFLLSFLVTAFLFLPDTNAVLIDPHCHQDCVSHTPELGSRHLALFGIVCLMSVIISLCWRSISALRRSLKLNRQFAFLSQQKDGYCVVRAESPTVFTLGWWNPLIYISDTLLGYCSAKDLSVILDHERAHLQRRDNLRLLAARIFSAGLPRTLVAGMRGDLADMTEQACDFQAADRHGYLDVAQVLLNVQRVLLSHPAAPIPAGACAFIESQVEGRVRALLDAEGRLRLEPWQLTILGLAILAGLLLLAEPLHHGAEWLFDWSNYYSGWF